MAFKQLKTYNEERFKDLFLLRNHGDDADVVFLYRSEDDVLVADAHYIKSSDYSGYVHCTGRGCPACAKGIRVQTRLFIPLYNIGEDSVQFWDRSTRFEQILMDKVFRVVKNPSEYVFRITRNGVAGDIKTTYEIQVIGKNSQKPYGSILAAKGIEMPDYYNNVCKEVSKTELAAMLSRDTNSNDAVGSDLPDYSVTPRRSSVSEDITSTGAVTAMDPPFYEDITSSGFSDDAEPLDGEPVF